MKKTYRVKTNKDFKMIFDNRKSKANKQFVVYVLKKEEQEHIRVGLSVSKKLGNAVIRNRIKRKIRRAIFEINDILYKNYDIIIIARNPVVEMSVEDMKSSLKHVFKLCQLIKTDEKVEEKKSEE
ncbi:ribonuclease P protein component [Granulicatella sp. zg-ZJ]|uniref:ribonuclease P protein component n=1 Tax=unclassified Granulicatella TaxID=2630493 RepID=UPI0013BEC56F|nr:MULTISPECIES: ribonuclease P protein component [unclassified Granulicatella]MBS4750245.1 ribonuclease P protein component [Carnobacteriaceae bacterium zg-ZUI78]NEW62486.1 ribonuclease P protein component [Granulicatella sp. zg-ZJ]NEW66534.1 ribonuclease P protein component [Granulicatella sp. zg-84]QMI85816.1 ribonuclease P protein component [Carnobacteriaceae bacterium zg-84]